MFTKFKSALYNVVGSFDPTEGSTVGSMGSAVSSQHSFGGAARSSSKDKVLRFPYTRPVFLQLNSDEEVLVTADHNIRPIICPRDISRLPWNAGYSETVNAGKSKRNEDQASIHVGLLTRCVNKPTLPTKSDNKMPLVHESAMNGYLEAMHKQPDATSSRQSSETTLDPQGLQSLHGNSLIGAPKQTFSTRSIDQHPSHASYIDNKGQMMVYLPYYYFGVFDGHAGWGAAVSAANQLHHIIHEKLCDVIDLILPDVEVAEQKEKLSGPFWYMERSICPESAIIGALEQAFWTMDKHIEEDRTKYQLNGGCTACIALFILGKLFVSNAGDSRGILSLNSIPHPMSFDFTPETETYRIRKLGALHPELLGGEYTHLEFLRRPFKRDLGKRAIYRDHYMSGWAYKTIKQDDLKYPLVCGEGKRSRVLATIGVTRGFGDHDLRAQCSSLPIKPFLSPEPEVRVFDLDEVDLSDSDGLILGTDGLWDVTSNQKAVESVCNSLEHFPPEDLQRNKYRYTSAAQDLVMGSRGKSKEHNWRTIDDKHATIDDISVFVVPLKPYQEESREWASRYNSLIKQLKDAESDCSKTCPEVTNGTSPSQHYNSTDSSDTSSRVVLHASAHTESFVDFARNAEQISCGPMEKSVVENINELERERKVLCLEKELPIFETQSDSMETSACKKSDEVLTLSQEVLKCSDIIVVTKPEETDLENKLFSHQNKSAVDPKLKLARSLPNPIEPVEDYFEDCDKDEGTVATDTQMDTS